MKHKYEIVFRTVYDSGAETEAILMSEESNEPVTVYGNMAITNRLDHGERFFSMSMFIPQGEDEEPEDEDDGEGWTVAEFITALKQFDQDSKIVFKDGGLAHTICVSDGGVRIS